MEPLRGGEAGTVGSGTYRLRFSISNARPHAAVKKKGEIEAQQISLTTASGLPTEYAGRISVPFRRDPINTREHGHIK